MADPITASVVLKTMAKAAIAKVSGKILESIAPGVFSNKKDFEEIKKELSKISMKLDEVLEISRSTFRLVEMLPDIVDGFIDGQTLYMAQGRIEASITVYISLKIRPNTISYNELTDLVQAWNTLIDKETKTSVVNHLPRYGEYLLSATDGKLYLAVLHGVQNKVDAVLDSQNIKSSQILDLATEAEKIISSDFINSGSILNGEPWISWNPKGNRTRKERECVPLPCSVCNGDLLNCWDIQVPDTAWNNELASKISRLFEIRKLISLAADDYRSLVVTNEILNTFKESLNTRKDIIISPASTLKVIERNFPFDE